MGRTMGRTAWTWACACARSVGLYSSHGLAHGSFAHGRAQGLSQGLSHDGIARPGAQVSEHRQLHQCLCAKSNVRGNL